MAKKSFKHGLDENNISGFVAEINDVIKKYNHGIETSDLVIRTDFLNVFAKNIKNCPPDCRRAQVECDIRGKNCKIVWYCDC